MKHDAINEWRAGEPKPDSVDRIAMLTLALMGALAVVSVLAKLVIEYSLT